MNRYINATRRLGALVRDGRVEDVKRQMGRWVGSEAIAYGLSRDATTEITRPTAKIPITVRPIEPRDVDLAFVQEIEKSEGSEKMELVRRYQLYQLGTPTGYVAVTEDDEPCYMQWLITSEQNAAIQKYFDGLFPILGPDEALLEMAYTMQKFRRNRIMAEAMARIAEAGFEQGVKRVITFVGISNVSSLKGCKLAGFSPFTQRSEKWSMFRRSVTMTPIPEGAPNIDLFAPRSAAA